MWLILLLLLIFIMFSKTKENFASSPGAFIQLYGKGPQDIYLTGDENFRYNIHYKSRPIRYFRELYP
jgi:hypothetical protein